MLFVLAEGATPTRMGRLRSVSGLSCQAKGRCIVSLSVTLLAVEGINLARGKCTPLSEDGSIGSAASLQRLGLPTDPMVRAGYAVAYRNTSASETCALTSSSILSQAPVGTSSVHQGELCRRSDVSKLQTLRKEAAERFAGLHCRSCGLQDSRPSSRHPLRGHPPPLHALACRYRATRQHSTGPHTVHAGGQRGGSPGASPPAGVAPRQRRQPRSQRLRLQAVPAGEGEAHRGGAGRLGAAGLPAGRDSSDEVGFCPAVTFQKRNVARGLGQAAFQPRTERTEFERSVGLRQLIRGLTVAASTSLDVPQPDVKTVLQAFVAGGWQAGAAGAVPSGVRARGRQHRAGDAQRGGHGDDPHNVTDP